MFLNAFISCATTYEDYCVEMMGLILPTSYASALCLMLGASHLVALRSTLVEQSSSARLQAWLADSLCVDYLAQVTTRRLSMTVAVAVAIEEASK